MKHVAVETNPATGIIYAGGKQNITNMAIRAVAESLLITNENMVFEYGSGDKRKQYMLAVVEV